MKKKHLILTVLITLFVFLFAYISLAVFIDVPDASVVNNRMYSVPYTGQNFSGKNGTSGTSLINLTILNVTLVSDGNANMTDITWSFSNCSDLFPINATGRNATTSTQDGRCNALNCQYFMNSTSTAIGTSYRFNASDQFFPNEGQYNMTVNASNSTYGGANAEYMASVWNTTVTNIRIDRSSPNITAPFGNWSHHNVSFGAVYGGAATGRYHGVLYTNNTHAEDNMNFNVTITDFNITLSNVFANISNVSMDLASDNEGNNYTNGSYITVIGNVTYGNFIRSNTSAVRNSHHEYNVNFSLNVSRLGEGHHNITFIMNDTVNNTNNTGDGVQSGSFTFNFTIDRSPPVSLVLCNFSDFRTANETPSITFNFSDDLSKVADCVFIMNETRNGAPVIVGENNASANATNITIFTNHTIGDGSYWVTVNCTDAAGNMVNSSDAVNMTVDTTQPSITLLKTSNSATSLTIDITTSSDASTCTTDRSSASVSGGPGSSQTITESSLAPATSYSYTVSCADDVGNTGRKTESFTTGASSAGSGSGGGGGVTSSSAGSFAKSVWTSIEPGQAAIIPVENGEIGATKVSFEVEEEIAGVWVNVMKVDTLPESVPSLPAATKTYKYMEIRGHGKLTEDKIKDGKIFFKVTEEWLEENDLQKTNIALYRFADGSWNELTTRITNEEEGYVHYESDTPGFSYFAIGQSTETVAAIPSEEVAGEEAQEAAEKAAAEEAAEAAAAPAVPKGKAVPWWVWVIAVAIIGGVVYYFVTRNKE